MNLKFSINFRIVTLKLFLCLHMFTFANAGDIPNSTYQSNLIKFIQQQKSQLGIPHELSYEIIIQKFNNNIKESDEWPRFLVLKFEKHIDDSNQYANHYLQCITKVKGISCSKNTISYLKYKNRWIRNNIEPPFEISEIIDVIHYADKIKPHDWFLPVLRVESNNDLVSVCFGDSESEPSYQGQYDFPRYCLPIKRLTIDGIKSYHAQYDKIERSSLIVD